MSLGHLLDTPHLSAHLALGPQAGGGGQSPADRGQCAPPAPGCQAWVHFRGCRPAGPARSAPSDIPGPAPHKHKYRMRLAASGSQTAEENGGKLLAQPPAPRDNGACPRRDSEQNNARLESGLTRDPLGRGVGVALGAWIPHSEDRWAQGREPGTLPCPDGPLSSVAPLCPPLGGKA